MFELLFASLFFLQFQHGKTGKVEMLLYKKSQTHPSLEPLDILHSLGFHNLVISTTDINIGLIWWSSLQSSQLISIWRALKVEKVIYTSNNRLGNLTTFGGATIVLLSSFSTFHNRKQIWNIPSLLSTGIAHKVLPTQGKHSRQLSILVQDDL